MFFNGFLALSLRTLLVWENKKLDKKYGAAGKEMAARTRDEADTNAGEENYGSAFRYIL